MPFQPGQSGNPSGQKDRRKTKAQIAITHFVDDNAERLQSWLDKIAEDDPKEAFKAFTSVVEYALPKLARKELVGDPDAPVQTVTRVELVAGGNGTDSTTA